MGQFNRAPDKIFKTHRAFTIRLPKKLYDKLFKEAHKEKRSVSAQMNLFLEQKYGR